MIIEIEMNNMGDIKCNPKNQKVLKRLGKEIWEFNTNSNEDLYDGYMEDCCIYLQVDHHIESFYKELSLTKSQIYDIEHGWAFSLRVHDDIFLRWFEFCNGFMPESRLRS